jgi:hypothetical protein
MPWQKRRTWNAAKTPRKVREWLRLPHARSPWACWPKSDSISSSDYRPTLEWLEDRTLPSGAVPTPLTLLPGITIASPPPVTPYTDATELPKASLAVGDLTGSGQDDFVIAQNWVNQMTVEMQQSGAAALLEEYGVGQNPHAVRLVDLTGNGIKDLVVADTGDNQLLVFLGQGNGEFAAPLTFATGTGPVAIEVADLNDDGTPDLVVANSDSNTVSLFFSQGTGAAWSLQTGPQLAVGDYPVAVEARDVDGTGDPDLFVADAYSNDVYQFNNLGGGQFDTDHPIVYPVGIEPMAVFVGHFESTTSFDLVTVDAGSDALTGYRNVTSTGAAGGVWTMALGGSVAVCGIMADFQQNGYDDLAVADFGNATVTFLNGSAQGLVIDGSVSLGSLTHPTDLALGSDGTSLYVVGTDFNSVLQVDIPTVDLSPNALLVPSEAISSDGSLGGPSIRSGVVLTADLAPLAGSSEALVAILADSGDGLLSSPTSTTGLGERRLDGVGLDGTPTTDGPGVENLAPPSAPSEVILFISGQEEQLLRQHREAVDRVYDFDGLDINRPPLPAQHAPLPDLGRAWPLGPGFGDEPFTRTAYELAREVARWLHAVTIGTGPVSSTLPNVSEEEGVAPVLPATPIPIVSIPAGEWNEAPAWSAFALAILVQAWPVEEEREKVDPDGRRAERR